MMLLMLLMLLALVSHQPGLAQTGCTVQERREVSTISGEFGTSLGTVRLTLPLGFHVEMTVFLEVSNGSSAESQQDMWMESGGERVRIRNGAALHVAPKEKERLLFSLVDSEGERLCTWQPPAKVLPPTLKYRPGGFLRDPFEWSAYPLAQLFLNLGEPILLSVGEGLGRGSGDFRIGGFPAMVLARNPAFVILRDPQPTVGLRTIESEGYRITLPFVDTQLQLPKPSSHGGGVVKIKVLGADILKPPAYLNLANHSRDVVRLLSGRASGIGSEWDDFREFVLHPIDNGAFTATCRVQFLQEGRIDLYSLVLHHEKRALPWRDLIPPIVPFPKL